MRPNRLGQLLARGGVFALIALGFACLLPAQSQQPALSEAQAKAAFVYNFAKFVEWPDEANSPGALLVVGVVGDPQLAALLDETLRNKSVRGRPFEVRLFASSEDLTLCHILVVVSGDKLTVQRILHVAQDSPTLTIGEFPGFSDWGGVIELVLQDNKFRFEINAGAARRGGLRISSRLLHLARAVKGN
jgi:YfiR/HmsC-like